jgi:hypothetical protein
VVSLLRHLVDAGSDAGLADLARALRFCSQQLSALGRHDDASVLAAQAQAAQARVHDLPRRAFRDATASRRRRARTAGCGPAA